MKAALIQFCASDSPPDNLTRLLDMMDEAAGTGADLILTPEVSNCVSLDRAHQAKVLSNESDDPVLAAMIRRARDHGVWLSIGSLALKGGAGGRFVNRSFLVDSQGQIRARYDKIHMFDVAVSETEVYRESSGYAAGERSVVAESPFGGIGLSICYDVRFPHLYRKLAQAGARILLVPSAFSPVTGAAHWETLLRARAIETGSFVLAAAQTGSHIASKGEGRQTYGHSLAVDPWGRVLLDAGTDEGVFTVDVDLSLVAKSRQRIPSLTHDRTFD